MELESAVERLYTDESLAADVDDATAKPLLKWAETQLPGLIAKSGDAGFDDAFIKLKKLIKSIARLIDGRSEMDELERSERAEKIGSFAQELGIAVDLNALPSLASLSGPEIVAQLVGSANQAAADTEPAATEASGSASAAPPPNITEKSPAASAETPAVTSEPGGGTPYRLTENATGSAPPLELTEAVSSGDAATPVSPDQAEPSAPTALESLFKRFAEKFSATREQSNQDNTDDPNDKE